MSTDDLSETIKDMRHNYIAELVASNVPYNTAPEEWNLDHLKQDLFNTTGMSIPVDDWAKIPNIDSDEMLEKINQEIDKNLEEKNKDIPEHFVRLVEKSFFLQTLDQLWKEHIATLDLMRHTIVLRAYGQKDPLNEYKREAFNMFSDMLDILKEKITTLICHMSIKQSTEQDLKEQEARQRNQKMTAFHEGFNSAEPVAPENRTTETPLNNLPFDTKNISRNSPCPCGSGKKFKHCHGKVA